MKEFFRTLFACLVALFLAGAMWMFMFFVVLGTVLSLEEPRPEVPDGAVLVFDTTVNLVDKPVAEDEQMLSMLFDSGEPSRMQLRQVVDAIDAAAKDDRISAILLHGNFMPMDLGTGYPSIIEVRRALERFRESGKPIIAYLVGPSMQDHLVASVADRIIMDPMGVIDVAGLSAEVAYMGGTLEKIGVGIQIARAGEYKSAGEAFKERHMSPQEREQITALLGDIWKQWLAEVGRSRGLPPEQLQKIVDERGVLSFEPARELGFVDEGLGLAELIEDLKETYGESDDEETFRQVSMFNYLTVRRHERRERRSAPVVAVVYAEGQIVDGESSGAYLGGDSLARTLRAIGSRDDVAAVVLRVNSPGGSAIASEVIRRELERLHEDVPIVVSMGMVAASGGYWISTESDHIFAESSTITGSIGVIAILPDIQKLGEKIDLNFETVRTGEHAGIFSIVEPRSEASLAVIQSLVDETYEKFKTLVSEGRGIELEQVEAIAGGRVWSGEDALERGLVDEIGGLREAVAHAAKLAELDEYRVLEWPQPKDFLERLRERIKDSANPIAGKGPAGELRRYLEDGRRAMEALNDPGHAYALMPQVLRVR
ncbi:MAG: signal peptide peptidase SppA [Verrucomicrobia bacterium]|nr:MAG: signal peptide peptidase SppA [Verrucomicrobiota bacterium]